MTIIRVSGGLGNQMFQYALGRALSEKNRDSLALDVSSYANQKPGEAVREYSLDHFNITAPASSLSRLHRWSLRFTGKAVFEKTFAFMPEVLDLSGSRYMAGVWQSEKYFKSAEKEIKAEFTLKDPFSSKAASMLSMIQDSSTGDAVSIHVRRGDQVSDPHLAKKHGLLGQDYYKAAIAHMRAHAKDPRFFIFSDEPEWVKANLDVGPDAVIVSGQGIPDYEELVLMSRCSHQIIAKSSFSWWGAWLNANPRKIVVAPKQRFGTADRSDDKDLIPSSWIQL